MQCPIRMPLSVLDQHNARTAQEICGLMASAYAVEARLLGVADFPPLRRARVAQLNVHSDYVGIRCGGLLVAAAEIENGCDGGNVIAALVVRPERFRQGLGERLVRDIVGNARGRRLDVSTARDNGPARALYTKADFRPILHWNTPDGFCMVTLRHNGIPAA